MERIERLKRSTSISICTGSDESRFVGLDFFSAAGSDTGASGVRIIRRFRERGWAKPRSASAYPATCSDALPERPNSRATTERSHLLPAS